MNKRKNSHSDNEFFTHLNEIKLPQPVKTFPKILGIILSLLVLILIFTPWVQNSQGVGYVIATDPNDRAQTINAPVNGRIKKWYVRDGSIVKTGDKLVDIIDNDPLILERLKSDRDAKGRKFTAAEIAAETAKLNYDRQEALFNKGLSSRKEYEDAKIEYKKLLSAKESAASELADSEIKLSRQENQTVLAPKDGVILKVLSGNDATQVKAGDQIATFAPNLGDPAIELYVSGNDIPLIKEKREARIRFEGWPVIQVSGWPSLAIGTFKGYVSSVDSSISENGKFRVIIKRVEGEEWPDSRFLRHGARVYGWILLNEVSLGYEIWRQVNSFPPTFDEQITSSKKPTQKDENKAKN